MVVGHQAQSETGLNLIFILLKNKGQPRDRDVFSRVPGGKS
jgi:hypothetical protein